MRTGREAWQLCLSIWGDMGRWGQRGKKTDSEVAAVLLCRVIKEEAPILVDDVFQEGSKTENALH